MKHSKNAELDVDFIGGQLPLTKEEAKAITDYLNSQKSNKKKLLLEPTRSLKRKKSIV